MEKEDKGDNRFFFVGGWGWGWAEVVVVVGWGVEFQFAFLYTLIGKWGGGGGLFVVFFLG